MGKKTQNADFVNSATPLPLLPRTPHTSGYMPHHSDILAPRESTCVNRYGLDSTQQRIGMTTDHITSKDHIGCSTFTPTCSYVAAWVGPKIKLKRLEAGCDDVLSSFASLKGLRHCRKTKNRKSPPFVIQIVKLCIKFAAPGLSSCPCPFLPQL